MLTEDFLTYVLPEDGIKFAILDAKKHIPTDTTTALAKIILDADARGRTCYFACSSFRDASTRKQTNVEAIKSFWLDVDCGEGKDYPDQRAALSAVVAFCKQASIPRPLLVNSGYGLHCYWSLTQTLNQLQWDTIGSRLRALLEHFGLKFDHSRDRDSASILRPVGSHNRKVSDSPRQVSIIGAVPALLDPRAWIRAVGTAYNKFCPNTAEVRRTTSQPSSLNSDLSLPPGSYPPANAELVADQCAQIRHLRDTGGGSYHQWFMSVGVVKHCKDGEALVHEWSSQYPGYSERETQTKLDTWSTGPSTCKAFADADGLCKTCTHSVTSPILLGNDTPAAEPVAYFMDPETNEEKAITLPKGYRWTGNWLVFDKAITVPDGNGGTTTEIESVPFCRSKFYLIDRIEDANITPEEDTGVRLQVRVERPRGGDKDFVLPARFIGERGSNLHGLLAAHEIVGYGKTKPLIEDYLVSFLDKLRHERESIQAFRTFGWQGPENFLLGRTLYTQSGGRQVSLSGNDVISFVSAFDQTQSATADPTVWAQLIDRAYNHPDHEQYQLVMYAGFGSILVDLLDQNTGSVLSLYGGKGQGKTTAAKLALSIYGNPNELMTTWDLGTTINAALKRCEIMRSVPVLFDEMSNADPKSLSSVIYALGNGHARGGLKPDGSLRKKGGEWRLTGFVTTNSSLHGKFSSEKDDASAEISRIVELQWENVTALTLSEMTEIERQLKPHYGAAAAVYVPYVVKHRAEVQAVVDRIRASLDTKLHLGRELRFWSLILATTLAGGWVANKLGLVQWDWQAVYQYALTVGRRNRERLQANVMTLSDSFHAMISALSPQILTTHTELDGKTAIDTQSHIHGEPVGRCLLEEGALYLSVRAIRDWCKSHYVDFTALQNEAIDSHFALDVNAQYAVGRGTRYATGRVRCWKLDWDAMGSLPHISTTNPPLKVVK